MKYVPVIQIKMDMDCFHKKHEPSQSRVPRILLEMTTGICLGRCDWLGEGIFLVSPAQYGMLMLVARQNDRLWDALMKAEITEGAATIFKGKGID